MQLASKVGYDSFVASCLSHSVVSSGEDMSFVN